MASQAVVWCLSSKGTFRLEAASPFFEAIFDLTHTRHLLSAQYLPGRQNIWADKLSHWAELSLEWQLLLRSFTPSRLGFSVLAIDLFAALTSHLLPFYLSLCVRTAVGGLDAFSMDWNR